MPRVTVCRRLCERSRAALLCVCTKTDKDPAVIKEFTHNHVIYVGVEALLVWITTNFPDILLTLHLLHCLY